MDALGARKSSNLAGYDRAGVWLPQCGSRSCRPVKIGGNEIDIALYADVLRRHRTVVFVGVALTVALAVLSYVRVSPSGISYRSPEIWSNQATLVFTQEGAPELRSVLPARPGGFIVSPTLAAS